MKRNFLPAAFIAMGMLALASCGGNKTAETTQNETPKEVEEQVETVLNEEEVPGIQGTPYNASFFNDAAKKSDTPTDSTYAVTESGLKYTIVEDGKGKKPTATDIVTVDYTGCLTNGQVFDSSIDRGEPTEFPLNRVIPGWTEGLQLMKEGGTAVFYIPSELAYGEQGVPGNIPPSAPLIFWVKLIKVGQ